MKNSPLRKFQIGLALLIIFGNLEVFQFLTIYGSESFHFSMLPAAWVPSVQILDDLCRARVLLSVFVLLNIAVTPVFALLGLSGLCLLLAAPTGYHHHAYLLDLLCLWAACCGKPSLATSQTSRWQQHVFLIQLSAVYGIAALHKLLMPDWVSGRTLFAIASNGAFYWATPFLTPWSLSFVAPSVIAVEFFLAVAFWFRTWRRRAVMVGILFHLSLEAMMPLGYFSWEMLLLYLVAVGDDEPALVSPLWACSLIGIALFGLRNSLPAVEVVRPLALPLGIFTVIVMATRLRSLDHATGQRRLLNSKV